MVVFGSLTYFYNFSQHFRDIDEALGNQPGSTKIGDAIQYGAGVAFALNERSSLSLSFTQRFGERTTIRRDGGSSQVIVGSQSNVGLFNVRSEERRVGKESVRTCRSRCARGD